jgi:hypothetical protein
MVTPAGFASVIESLRLAGDPEPHAVTYGIKVNETSPPLITDLLEVLASLFNQHVMGTMPPQYSHINTHLEWSVLAPPAPQLVGDRASSTAGANPSGNLVPQNSAYLIRKNTALGGNRHRGRMYLPGVSEASVTDNGVIDGNRLAEINPAMGNWLAALKASAPIEDMVLLHSTSLLSPTPAPTTVSSLICQGVIATQRRRLR